MTHLSDYKDVVIFYVPLSLLFEVAQLSIPDQDQALVPSMLLPRPPLTLKSFSFCGAPVCMVSLMHPLYNDGLLDCIEAFVLTT